MFAVLTKCLLAATYQTLLPILSVQFIDITNVQLKHKFPTLNFQSSREHHPDQQRLECASVMLQMTGCVLALSLNVAVQSRLSGSKQKHGNYLTVIMPQCQNVFQENLLNFRRPVTHSLHTKHSGMTVKHYRCKICTCKYGR